MRMGKCFGHRSCPLLNRKSANHISIYVISGSHHESHRNALYVPVRFICDLGAVQFQPLHLNELKLHQTKPKLTATRLNGITILYLPCDQLCPNTADHSCYTSWLYVFSCYWPDFVPVCICMTVTGTLYWNFFIG